MTMSVSIPSELEPFVQQELAAGAFRNETELVAKALELYREMKNRHVTLLADVERSISQGESGDVAPLDIEAIKNRLRGELDESGQPKP